MRVSPFNRDRTKVMISVGFFAVFLLMLLVTYLSMSTLSRVNRSMADLIHNPDQKPTLAYQMRDVIRLRSSEVRTMAQYSDPEEREKTFDKIFQSTQTYNTARTALIELGANPRENEVLTKIAEADERVHEAYDKAGNQIYNMLQDTDGLKSVLGNVQLRELVLLNHLNGLVQLEKTLSDEALSTNQKRYKKTRQDKKTRQALLGAVIAAFVVSLIISATVINRVSRANNRIKHLASHDDLTGLNNRRSFEETLQHTMSIAPRSRSKHGLLYLDFDRFKIVNDSCGHHAGDQLLIELSQLLSQRLRKGDLFARVGGDEFSIIAEADSFEDIVSLADDLREIVQDYTFEYQSQTFKISVSIGVVPITGHEDDIETVLQDVDSACYVAKQLGRNRVHVAQHDDIEVVKYRNDIAGIQSIRTALDENLLTLFYQPVYRIQSESVEMAHCEILLRIQNEDGDLVSPGEFIPIAEKYNLMAEIDRWVISNVMAWVAEHQVEYQIPRFLINLSGLSFIDEDFLEFVVEQLDTNEIDPTKIAFEITETAAVDNIAKANEFIARLRAIGCSFALDDFGTGFSTFAYLKNLPIDYLKIDGSLVQNIPTDSVDREMVRAINDIGHTVGAKTIAEFVEDEETVELLRAMGVDYAQGFGLQRPDRLDSLLNDLHSTDREVSEWRQAG